MYACLFVCAHPLVFVRHMKMGFFDSCFTKANFFSTSRHIMIRERSNKSLGISAEQETGTREKTTRKKNIGIN